MRPFTAPGVFWLPSSPSRQVAGKLIFDSRGLRLMLIDHLTVIEVSDESFGTLQPEWTTFERVFGRFTDGPFTSENTLGTRHHVTVFGVAAMVLAFPSAEMQQTWDAEAAVIGAHTLASSTSKTRLFFDALAAWANAPAIVTTQFTDGTFTSDASERDLFVATSETTSYRIKASVAGTWGRNIHLDRETFFEVEDVDALPFVDIPDAWVRPLHDLLVVCIGGPVGLTDVRVWVDSIHDQQVWALLISTETLTSDESVWDSTQLRLQGSEALLLPDDPAVGFDYFLPEWLDLRRDLPKAIDQLTSVSYAPFMYAENRYGNLFKAAEDLAKKSYETAELPKPAHRHRVRSIVDAALSAEVPREHVEWADRVLSSKNESPLHKLVGLLIDDCGAVGRGIVSAVPNAPRRMAAARTAASHGGMEFNQQIQHELSIVLSFVLRLHLLREIGADPGAIEAKTLRARSFSRALRRLAALTAT